jgi:DNA-binding NarL/FixJ family response regulator
VALEVENVKGEMKARILIADDSSSVRGVFKELLESHSSHWKICAEAANGLEAVEKAIRSKPELVIMDLQMPLMDGLTASKRIVKSLPGVSILMNTVHKSDYVDSEARKVGVRDVISKSDSGMLLKAVEGLMGMEPKCNETLVKIAKP